MLTGKVQGGGVPWGGRQAGTPALALLRAGTVGGPAAQRG